MFGFIGVGVLTLLEVLDLFLLDCESFRLDLADLLFFDHWVFS